MKPLLAFSLMALAVPLTTVGTASAQTYSNMDAYRDCWRSASAGNLAGGTVTKASLDAAAEKADQTCSRHREAAAREHGAERTQRLRGEMETALYQANPVGVVASRVYRPKNPHAKFNITFAWLCRWPSDVSKFRNLLAANERQAAFSMEECITVEKPVEVIQTDSIGNNLIQVSLVNGSRTIDLWTEREMFQDRRSWLIEECQQTTGASFSACLDMTRP